MNKKNNEEYDQNEEEEIEEEVSNKKVWQERVQPLIDKFCSKSHDLIHSLGTLLSFDEMIICCMGRIGDTHKMRNKPIDCGYNSFALTTYNGYCINFTPDGQLAQNGIVIIIAGVMQQEGTIWKCSMRRRLINFVSP